MDPAAHAREAPVVETARAAQQIEREGGRERREGRSRGGPCARNQPHDEQHPHDEGQSAVHGHLREDLIALSGHREPRAVHVEVEKHAEHEEQQDHPDLAEGREHDIFLRVARVAQLRFFCIMS